MSDTKIKYCYPESYKKAISKYRETEHGKLKVKEYSVNYHLKNKENDEYLEKKRNYSRLQYEKVKERKKNDAQFNDMIKKRRRENYLKSKTEKQNANVNNV